MTIKDWLGQVDEAAKALVAQYHTVGLALAGTLGLVVLFVAALVARKRRRPLKPVVIFIGTNLGLLLNAEGMWDVLVTKASVPKGFAVLVFAVFEIALMIAMDKAKASYRATAALYTEAGVDRNGRPYKPGDIRRAGTAGSALYVVWFIALLSGTIVATNGGSVTTVLLRLGLPVVIVLLWWISVTAEAVTLKRRTTFKYSPYRVGVRRGWWAPEDDEDDAEAQMRAEAARATEAKMVTLGHRLEAGTPGAWLWERRLAKAVREVDEDAVERVAARVQLAAGAVARIAPSRAKVASTVEQHSTPAQASTEQHALETSTPAQHTSTDAGALDHAEPPAAGTAQASTPKLTDTQAAAVLTAEVDRRAGAGEGPLSFREAGRLIGAGNDRTRRLIGVAGLAQDATGKVVRPVDGAAPVNGSPVPELADAVAARA